MRGDLHTLKRVCSYASVVMLVGEAAFAVLAAAVLILGGIALSDGGFRQTFIDLIWCRDSDASIIAGAVEMCLIFVALFITVMVIHDIMVSIQREHSPFMEETPDGFKLVCITYLLAASPLMALEYLCREDFVLALCIALLCILIAVVMYCLTIIFRYGHLLQEESDHTL
jgi:hypothetical protein